MGIKVFSEEWQKSCEIARKKSYERSKRRKEIEKEGNLPYSFAYKIRSAFVGNECPICKRPMGVSIRSDDDPVITKTPEPTIQHNIPLSLGGKNVLENISVICRSCNSTIRNNITGDLNNKEVVETWQRMIAKDTIG